MHQDDESALVERWLAGAAAAAELIFNDFWRPLWLCVANELRDGGDPNWRASANDVTQEVALKILNGAWKKFDPAKGTLLGWLLTVARNTARDYLRRWRIGNERYEELDAPANANDGGATRGVTIADPNPGPEERVLISEETERQRRERLRKKPELRDAMRDCFASMHRPYYECLMFSYGVRLSRSEIADLIGITEGAVNMKMHHALKALRRGLLERGYDFVPGATKSWREGFEQQVEMNFQDEVLIYTQKAERRYGNEQRES